MTFLSKTVRRLGLAAVLAPLAAVATAPAQADGDPFIGELMLVGENFCPRGWTDANGQLLSIASNTALFSLFGTTFGGDGRTSFGIPDLRGRVAISEGTGPGLPTYPLGARGGAASFTLNVTQLPSHSHTVQAAAQLSNKGGPGNDFLGIPDQYNPNSQNDPVSIYHDGPPDTVMDTAMLTNSGGGQAVSHRGPYLTLRWCVATVGIYPSRS